MYQLLKPNEFNQQPQCVQRLSDKAFIPFDPANTDYANFINEINNDKAQLEDADGNLMTQEEAKAFVATLPQGDK